MEKAIQKLLDKLGKKGFDTEKKVNAIDMQVAYDNGLADELGGILALQKAIKFERYVARRKKLREELQAQAEK